MKFINDFIDNTNSSKSVVVSNPGFIFEVTQLSDTNKTRNERFRDDLRIFLELQELFPEAPKFTPESKLKGGGKVGKRRKQHKMINICDVQHIPLRTELMKHSRAIAIWVRDYLLKDSNKVIV